MNSFLPYGRQQIEDDDIAAVVSVLKSDWLTTGPQTQAFEKSLKKNFGSSYAVACSSATAGLYMSSKALGICSGSAVIVPTISFLASATAPHMSGAEIVFADVDSETGLMTPETLLDAINSHTGNPIAAVIVVHLCGRICDMPEIRRIAKLAGIHVIEDACHAIGASYSDASGQKFMVGACAHSDLSVFSFHPVKTIAAGEGGAVLTNEEDLASVLELQRNHGIIRDPNDWKYSELGFDEGEQVNNWYYEMHSPAPNYRMSDINAALANSQLKKLDKFISRRSELAALYDKLLVPLAPNILPPMRQHNVELGWHLYSVRIDFLALSSSRRTVIEFLKSKGIGSQVHYIPLHWQPYWQKHGWDRKRLRGASSYYEKTLSLPLFPSMSNEDVHQVCEALKECLSEHA